METQASLQDSDSAPVVWSPREEDVAGAQVTRFQDWLAARSGRSFEDYTSLWRWSVQEPEDFWQAIWDYYEVAASTPPTATLTHPAMPGTRWFPGARLNYAEHVLRSGDDEAIAIISIDEGSAPVEMTRADLRGQVGAMARLLQNLGVEPGDRVAGYINNVPAAVVTMLAATGIGAVWTAVSPDFGTRSVLDRLEQIEPKVLLATTGYRFNGREADRRDTVAEIIAGLPSVEHLVVVGADPAETVTVGRSYHRYETVVAEPGVLEPVHVDADHPLWILFSSGTTGKPKGIVQGHAGILVEHYKSLGLCMDLGPGDRYLFHSSTSWMAWNYLVGGLLHGSTIITYSGSPTSSSPDRLWRLAAETGATVLGMGSAYANGCAKAGVDLTGLDLAALRIVIPTGSPLPTGGWQWLTENLPARTRIDSICGGTDVCTVFFGGSQLLPVRLGRISGRWLGVDARAFDEDGSEVVGDVGEFVITSPMPSMPIGFWNDPDGARLRSAYFERFAGVWTQGDWILVHEDGSVEVLGRSDATLNRGGVRLGSADLYTVVESDSAVSDSLVVGVELPDGEYYMPLFVVPAEGHAVDELLRARLNAALREQLSPRHVPDDIIEVSALPRTLTGKKLEIPVKRILQGNAVETTVALGSIDRPELLGWFADFARGRSGS